jgi:hypothetical protein
MLGGISFLTLARTGVEEGGFNLEASGVGIIGLLMAAPAV